MRCSYGNGVNSKILGEVSPTTMRSNGLHIPVDKIPSKMRLLMGSHTKLNANAQEEKQHNERFIHNKRTRKKTNANIKKKMILVDRQAISAEIQPNIRAMAASANTGNPPSPPVTPQNKKTVRKEHSLLVRSQRSLSIATQDEDGCISALTFCLAPFANIPTLFPHYHSAMEDDSSFIGSER